MIWEDKCDGLLLLQANPPCSEARDCTATSDPEVQRVTTNPLARLGDEELREPFRAVTWHPKEEDSEHSGEMGEWWTLSGNTGKEDGDNEESRVYSNTDSPAETHTDDWTTRTSGAGGAQHRLRPRLGKSVAPSDAWLS
ncbi:hypothetical protein NDU88_006472 [Pleurodeles waltl]|uniref:Uncharacterized protein n=1 Tax=Pleurodeles waltl TaxID=8319 RepID=A0AAV7X1D8_PLEWA|nr:hypothetical protein NDU88_006472 [Pleurodeles waltl]